MELKAHRIDNIISAYKIGKAFCMKTEEEVYSKSEADKVIAELKEEAQLAHRVCSRQIQQIASNEQELRHQKYKRCLAMARWCESENYTECWYHENSERCEWTEKWHKRWLELADKFK